jgi:hypothetical protein
LEGGWIAGAHGIDYGIVDEVEGGVRRHDEDVWEWGTVGGSLD